MRKPHSIASHSIHNSNDAWIFVSFWFFFFCSCVCMNVCVALILPFNFLFYFILIHQKHINTHRLFICSLFMFVFSFKNSLIIYQWVSGTRKIIFRSFLSHCIHIFILFLCVTVNNQFGFWRWISHTLFSVFFFSFNL